MSEDVRMRILFVGDVVGRPGRTRLAQWIATTGHARAIDLVIANGENAAGGLGVTPKVLDELHDMGVHAITLGNHTWRKRELAPALDKYPAVVRPANYPRGVPGKGATLITLPDGRRVGVVCVVGRVFMTPFECPFERAAKEAAALRTSTPIVIVDAHAEATSEKAALGWHLDGACTAVIGTHTHVQTADERVLPKGTAFITDVGMTGPRDSVIGVDRERAIGKFLTGMPAEFRVAKGPVCFCAVIIEADETTGRATGIERLADFGHDSD